MPCTTHNITYVFLLFLNFFFIKCTEVKAKHSTSFSLYLTYFLNLQSSCIIACCSVNIIALHATDIFNNKNTSSIVLKFYSKSDFVKYTPNQNTVLRSVKTINAPVLSSWSLQEELVKLYIYIYVCTENGHQVKWTWLIWHSRQVAID